MRLEYEEYFDCMRILLKKFMSYSYLVESKNKSLNSRRRDALIDIFFVMMMKIKLGESTSLLLIMINLELRKAKRKKLN